MDSAIYTSKITKIYTSIEYHSQNIVHRDLKPGNILIKLPNQLKICDFGLARFIDPLTLENRKYLTPGLGTRRYSPPDVLLHSPTYGKSVDLWAVGCILIELWTKEFFISPLQLGFVRELIWHWISNLYFVKISLQFLFQENEISATLREITNIFGPINNNTLPGIERLFMYDTYRSKMNSFGERSFRKLYGSKVTSPEAFDLIDRLLVYDPSKRLTVEEAIEHEYFKRRIPPSGESEMKSHKKFWCIWLAFCRIKNQLM